MPQLKQLTCSIEIGKANTALKEYGVRYHDRHVSSFISVPGENIDFSVHLTSKGYIAPGLAMFVYIDGQYQCNRNKPGLVFPADDTPPDAYEIDLRVRQKEEIQFDGNFIGRNWSFSALKSGQFALNSIITVY